MAFQQQERHKTILRLFSVIKTNDITLSNRFQYTGLSNEVIRNLTQKLFQVSVQSATQLTPVIGGTCKLNSPDVQIGGKQTQFFLRCESNVE